MKKEPGESTDPIVYGPEPWNNGDYSWCNLCKGHVNLDYEALHFVPDGDEDPAKHRTAKDVKAGDTISVDGGRTWEKVRGSTEYTGTSWLFTFDKGEDYSLFRIGEDWTVLVKAGEA